MKSKLLTSIIFILTTQLFAQQTTKTSTSSNSSCDDIKKENEYLKKTLNINQSITSLNVGDVDFNVVKIKGDSKSQMVTIEVLLTNKIQNRNVSVDINNIKIVTLDGEIYKPSKYFLPSATWDNKIYLNTDVPIKISFVFGTMLPSTEYIKLFNLAFTIFDQQDYNKNIVDANEYRDLKIIWK